MAMSRDDRRRKRHFTIRQTLAGTSTRPRLAVFRSTKHIYAQVIDDDANRVVASASTRTPGLRDELRGVKKADKAKRVGEFLAKACLAQGVTQVAFDRGGFRYHGRIKALADGARSGGLQF